MLTKLLSGWGRAGGLGVLLLLLGSPVQARTVPDPGNPLEFFTAVADKLLRSTFPFGVTNIPVYSNGVSVYTPAVQRLLQLSANLCDANTNCFPSVFRPLFATDASNDVFIIGYLQVTNISGPTDPQLALPYDVTQLAGGSNTPIADASGPVNVYGVPWIIGAKKGLPGFNQFYLTNTVQVVRKLMFNRPRVGALISQFTTNQMFIMSFNTGLGFSFWNSYTNAYPDAVTVYAQDNISSTLSAQNNNSLIFSKNASFVYTLNNGITMNPWPGTQWRGVSPEASITNPSSAFVTAYWPITFLPPSIYRFAAYGGPGFDPIGSPTSSLWETTAPALPLLPNFELAMTNYLQAYILDGNHVIDYVQLRGPITSTNLGPAMTDPNYPNPLQNNVRSQWSTNAYPAGSPSYGLYNQIWVSGHPTDAPLLGGKWMDPTSFLPTSLLGLAAGGGAQASAVEAAYFNAFFTPAPGGEFEYNGQIYYNTQASIQAPYTPTRIIFAPFLFQANDPLVHYLASDLNANVGATAVWANGTRWANGVWRHVDDIQNSTYPQPPTSPVGGRYQPWGISPTAPVYGDTQDTGYNPAYKDPLVWWPDSWNFPTNLNLNGLGQIHRGTPWQTVYLKSGNVLTNWFTLNYFQAANYGSNLWSSWTGDADLADAALMAPVSDWRLAGLLMSLLNTNDPGQLLSVNDPNLGDWQNLLNGMMVYSNSAPVALPGMPAQFDTYALASNSWPVGTIAAAIVTNGVGIASPFIYSIGDILAIPALSTASPMLNFNDASQALYGISDAAYEAIPAQLLPLLRPDSFGTLQPTNGSWNLSFSGMDGYAYAVQVSSNFSDWISLSTNQPVQGGFSLPVSPGATSQFYRTVMLP